MSSLLLFGRIYSEIYFSRNSILGLVIAAITFLDPNVGLAGVIAIGSALAFEGLALGSELPKESFFYYNPLLVGLSIGALFKITFFTIFLISAAAIFTYVLTVGLNFVLNKYTGLPVLSIPFVIVSSFVYLAALRSSSLSAHFLQAQSPELLMEVPAWANGYFLSLGAIIFSKSTFAGVIIAGLLFIHSRFVSLLSVMGYCTGAFITGHFTASTESTYLNLNYFNYILIAIAVGSIFLIPSTRSFVIAFFAVAVSCFILEAVEVFFANYSLPAFTLPFNITVLAFIYYTDVVNSKLRTRIYLDNPEANLDFYLNYSSRFSSDVPLLRPPFSGNWKISQAFNGEFTHKGPWKYGVDFVLEDQDGREYCGNADQLENYYAFGKPVFSPISGTVTLVENTRPDCTPGTADRTNNWGNQIMIFSPNGFYVRICHLKQNSVTVLPGSFVEEGSLIGSCGSSGYSPFPHIHMQIQTSPVPSAPTLEFRLKDVLRENTFLSHYLPVESDFISAANVSIKRKSSFKLLLGQTFVYRDTQGQEKCIEVVLAEDGSSYLADGESRLYFETSNCSFRFYKQEGPKSAILSTLFQSLPSIPLIEDSTSWKDSLPLHLSLGSISRNIVLLIQGMAPNLFSNGVALTQKGNQIESTNITKFSFGRFELPLQKSWARLHVSENGFIQTIHQNRNGQEFSLNLETQKISNRSTVDQSGGLTDHLENNGGGQHEAA